LEKDFHIADGEKIFLEISQKYNEEIIQQLTTQSGFKVEEEFFDSKHYFTNQIWSPSEAD
jgi:L-histidine N-alpha-methyltransferase